MRYVTGVKKKEYMIMVFTLTGRARPVYDVFGSVVVTVLYSHQSPFCRT
jgi:hypothetical protein